MWSKEEDEVVRVSVRHGMGGCKSNCNHKRDTAMEPDK